MGPQDNALACRARSSTAPHECRRKCFKPQVELKPSGSNSASSFMFEMSLGTVSTKMINPRIKDMVGCTPNAKQVYVSLCESSVEPIGECVHATPPIYDQQQQGAIASREVLLKSTMLESMTSPAPTISTVPFQEPAEKEEEESFSKESDELPTGIVNVGDVIKHPCRAWRKRLEAKPPPKATEEEQVVPNAFAPLTATIAIEVTQSRLREIHEPIVELLEESLVERPYETPKKSIMMNPATKTVKGKRTVDISDKPQELPLPVVAEVQKERPMPKPSVIGKESSTFGSSLEDILATVTSKKPSPIHEAEYLNTKPEYEAMMEPVLPAPQSPVADDALSIAESESRRSAAVESMQSFRFASLAKPKDHDDSGGGGKDASVSPLTVQRLMFQQPMPFRKPIWSKLNSADRGLKVKSVVLRYPLERKLSGVPINYLADTESVTCPNLSLMRILPRVSESGSQLVLPPCEEEERPVTAPISNSAESVFKSCSTQKSIGLNVCLQWNTESECSCEATSERDSSDNNEWMRQKQDEVLEKLSSIRKMLAGASGNLGGVPSETCATDCACLFPVQADSREEYERQERRQLRSPDDFYLVCGDFSENETEGEVGEGRGG